MFQNFVKRLLKFISFIYSNTPDSWKKQSAETINKKLNNSKKKKTFECAPLKEFFESILNGNWSVIYNRDSYISIWSDLKKKWFK